jgi:hypothetical protein
MRMVINKGNTAEDLLSTVDKVFAAGALIHGGASVVQTHMTNSRLTDPEILESRYPILIERFGVRRGSGGEGEWRGGDGAVRVVRFREAGAVLMAKLATGLFAQNDQWFRGRTNNPWNTVQGSSGSSAGPASATAAGCVAFGIGTSQVRDVLASQCLAMEPLKVRRIAIDGRLGRGVSAKDVILEIIRRLGVNGGVGFAYEYAGAVVDRMTMDERMTLCNMSIEGGARAGYVNPDETTYTYLRGRRFVPQGAAFDRACDWWRSLASDAGAIITGAGHMLDLGYTAR